MSLYPRIAFLICTIAVLSTIINSKPSGNKPNKAPPQFGFNDLPLPVQNSRVNAQLPGLAKGVSNTVDSTINKISSTSPIATPSDLPTSTTADKSSSAGLPASAMSGNPTTNSILPSASSDSPTATQLSTAGEASKTEASTLVASQNDQSSTPEKSAATAVSGGMSPATPKNIASFVVISDRSSAADADALVDSLFSKSSDAKLPSAFVVHKLLVNPFDHINVCFPDLCHANSPSFSAVGSLSDFEANWDGISDKLLKIAESRKVEPISVAVLMNPKYIISPGGSSTDQNSSPTGGKGQGEPATTDSSNKITKPKSVGVTSSAASSASMKGDGSPTADVTSFVPTNPSAATSDASTASIETTKLTKNAITKEKKVKEPPTASTIDQDQSTSANSVKASKQKRQLPVPNPDPKSDTATGSTQDGSTQDGSTKDGSTQDGSTLDGSTLDGSTLDGSTKDGSTQDGSTQDGSTLDGSTQDGSTQDGSTKDATIQKVPGLISSSNPGASPKKSPFSGYQQYYRTWFNFVLKPENDEWKAVLESELYTGVWSNDFASEDIALAMKYQTDPNFNDDTCTFYPKTQQENYPKFPKDRQGNRCKREARVIAPGIPGSSTSASGIPGVPSESTTPEPGQPPESTSESEASQPLLQTSPLVVPPVPQPGGEAGETTTSSNQTANAAASKENKEKGKDNTVIIVVAVLIILIVIILILILAFVMVRRRKRKDPKEGDSKGKEDKNREKRPSQPSSGAKSPAIQSNKKSSVVLSNRKGSKIESNKEPLTKTAEPTFPSKDELKKADKTADKNSKAGEVPKSVPGEAKSTLGAPKGAAGAPTSEKPPKSTVAATAKLASAASGAQNLPSTKTGVEIAEKAPKHKKTRKPSNPSPAASDLKSKTAKSVQPSLVGKKPSKKDKGSAKQGKMSASRYAT